ncbi:unnamed protein product, partial [Rotaria magnacalcarata]
FSTIPERYDEIYLRLSRQGARVLALGHRSLGVLSNQQLREQYPTRNSVECNLDFCGFVVLSCPLKPDSKAMIRELRHSSHHNASEDHGSLLIETSQVKDFLLDFEW